MRLAALAAGRCIPRKITGVKLKAFDQEVIGRRIDLQLNLYTLILAKVALKEDCTSSIL